MAKVGLAVVVIGGGALAYFMTKSAPAVDEKAAPPVAVAETASATPAESEAPKRTEFAPVKARPEAAAPATPVAPPVVAEAPPAEAQTPAEPPNVPDFSSGEFFKHDAWADAGQDSPEAAAQSLLWAVMSGDAKRLAEVSGKKIDDPVSEGEIAWQKNLKEVDAARVVVGAPKMELKTGDGQSTGESLMSMEYQRPDGTTEQGYFGIKQDGDKWIVTRVVGYPNKVANSQAN